MRTAWLRKLLCLAVACCLFSTAVSADAPAAPFSAGDPMAETIRFEYAVYYLPRFEGDALKILREEAQALNKGLKVLPRPAGASLDGATVAGHLERDVPGKYAAPDVEALQYFGRGISREQAQALQTSREALVLSFAHPKALLWDGLRTADALVEKLARRTGGLIWDEQTRLMYTPDEWRKQHIDSWTATPPEVSKHFTIHAYKTDVYARAITLGMAKFGLPDIVVDQFSWTDERAVGNLINLFAQAMAEGARLDHAGQYDLNLRSIGNAAARDSQMKTLKPNAVAIAHLSLRRGSPDEGDPRNRLIEITFDRYPGKDAREQQDALLSALFGSEDQVSHIRHNAELLQASKKARARLPALQRNFQAGLAPGEFIQLKAPFDTPAGSHEYMWVEVTRWSKGGAIEGLLRNEPEQVPGLHGGALVTIREDQVFDYILRHADGSQEGNDTGRIIQKMQEEAGR